MNRLSVDLHCHLERDEDVKILADLVSNDLDILAITNHANKTDILIKQNERIKALSTLRPDLLLIFGIEWNVYGTHVNLIFPSDAIDEDWLKDFLHDFEPCDLNDQLIRAIRRISNYPDDIKPMLIFNHPAFPDPDISSRLVRDVLTISPALTLGVDGFHGHQGWEQQYLNPFDYPGQTVNGLSDLLYLNGIQAPLLAGSDFHPNKQSKKPDVPPGVFQRVLLDCLEKTYSSVFDALKNGHTFVVQNQIIRSISLLDFRTNNSSVSATIEIDVSRKIDTIEAVAGIGSNAAIVSTWRSLEPGVQQLTIDIRCLDVRYIRFRGKTVVEGRTIGDKSRLSGFATSAFVEDQL